MERVTNRLTCAAMTLGVLALLAITAGPAGAKKPVKPPPTPLDEGTVYYATDGVTYRMAPDGTDAALVLDVDTNYDYPFCEPSVERHGAAGERWFLASKTVTGERYPDGTRAGEVFAVSESGVSVQLTADASLQPVLSPRWCRRGSIVDGRVTFVAYRWEQLNGQWTSSPVLVAVDVDPENLRSHQVTSPTAVEGLTGFLRYDWSPDGSWIVYDDGSRLWRASAADDFENPVALTTDWGTEPRISVDGTRIAFRSGAGIEVMGADGSNREVIVDDPRDNKKSTKLVTTPTWSPGGTHLLYAYLTVASRTSVLHRVTSDGGDDATLTSDDGFCVPIGWRAEP